MSGLPVLFDATGPVATPPATIQQQLIADVEQISPGYTNNLPGSLIDDISSTDVGAIVTIDQARVDTLNGVSPYGANAYVLNQQGVMLGVPPGQSANGSVLVVFTGSPGYVIPPGFIVSDGANQYIVPGGSGDGGTVGSGGTSQPIFAVASVSGSFAIPAGSVNQTVSTVPSPYTLTVTNPLAGIPSSATETTPAYRARILNATNVSIQGTQTYLKTLVLMVPGVSSRLVSVRQVGAFWEVICGGGDPFQVSGAIYQGVSSVGLLTGSTTTIRNVTVSLYDAPDTYTVTYVNPAQQTVTLAITWNTTLANFTASASVNQLMIAAGQAYINGITVGQPINLLVLQEQCQAAVASVLAPVNLTTLQFAVTINGVPVAPTAGTSIIPSDPEGYFFVSPTGVTSVQ